MATPSTSGPVELIIVLVIALLVLGPGKLPEVGSAFGKTIREFRKASSDIQESVERHPRRRRPAAATRDGRHPPAARYPQPRRLPTAGGAPAVPRPVDSAPDGPCDRRLLRPPGRSTRRLDRRPAAIAPMSDVGSNGRRRSSRAPTAPHRAAPDGHRRRPGREPAPTRDRRPSRTAR